MLEALVKKHAKDAGFDLVGIAPVDAHEGLKFSRQWVERGFGGEMRFLDNPKRDDPRRVLPSAQSVICVGLIYNADLPYSAEVADENGNSKMKTRSSQAVTIDDLGRSDKERRTRNGFPVSNFQFPVSNPNSGPRGWISRYAWGTDYHKIMRSKLEKLRRAIEAMAPGVDTWVYVDTGPVVERAFARLSGIGWAGKNTCLINESKGSWFFLGVMLTSLALEPDMPAPDRCGTCTTCIEACPTGELVEPYVMDASRCIAYLNIELKGSIPEEFRPAIGANVVGCDICQDVCPWNGIGRSQESVVSSQNEEGGRRVATTLQTEFQPLRVASGHQVMDSGLRTPDHGQQTFSLFNPPLESLASLSEEDFRRIFQKSPIKRVKYRGWLRNLCVAMGNSGDSKFLRRLKYFRQHADPVVREHAEWAIARILKSNPWTAEFQPPQVHSPS
ncbi:MAG TPA: tRNA epoxyqueuosine(34) reductase QueG [Terriglobia bacterium]|nr:tRNA epoxyqueuosine(34) reductase QueG [Terriglobia bacterium]